MEAELRFDVMGTRAHVLVHGPAATASADRARDELDRLEQRWSRFLPASEISRLNDAGGAPVIVSPPTCELIARGIDGWRVTRGRFDPTVLGDVIRAGYDQSFDRLGPVTTVGVSDHRRGCGGIELDEELGLVRLPRGVGFDPGGIGKGLAADRVVRLLLEEGALGACVNVGGDVRVAGTAPGDTDWAVDVLDPFTHEPVDAVVLATGAVATSSRTRRRWHVGARPAHHLIDPRTGLPSTSGLAAVTVLAGDAWRAEVFAKAAFLAGPAAGCSFLEERGIAALLIDDDGTMSETSRWATFSRRCLVSA